MAPSLRSGMARVLANRHGKAALKRAHNLYARIWMAATSRYPVGTNVFERDWDLLVVLDTCRIDALREVAPEYDFVSDVDCIRSVACTSQEWMFQTFREDFRDEIAGTAYVTANPYLRNVLGDRQYHTPHLDNQMGGLAWHTASLDDFLALDEPWAYVPEDHKPFKHTPARYVTDAAVEVGREVDFDRMVVHYLEPHSPYTSNAVAEDRDLHDYEAYPMAYLQSGGDWKTVWEAYLDQLRKGLDDVELLLENVDAEKVVITADHGEAFGERGFYGHSTGLPSPHVRTVPWMETTAEDSGEYVPETERENEEERTTREQLEALGYL